MVSDRIDVFVTHFRGWVECACREWGLENPDYEYYQSVLHRLTDGIKDWVGKGIQDGIVIEDGWKFKLKGQDSRKGPYRWFSKNRGPRPPACNWEYFVQVAEYVRLSPLCHLKDTWLIFEDKLMDLAIYKRERLFAYIEVKENKQQLEDLVERISNYSMFIDITLNDRGNTPLRKAKYLVSQRPKYFSVIAIGRREDFRVYYPPDREFRLVPDILPSL